MTVSRQHLQEALRFQDQIENRLYDLRGTDPDIDALQDAFAALRAILDAPTLEWCETHGSSGGWAKPDGTNRCHFAEVLEVGPCQFETYVRVEVAQDV